MKTVRIEQYGDERVLQVVDMPKPQPASDQILIKVYAAGVNPMDWKIRDGAGARFGMSLPIFLGSEIAGIVEEVGENITTWSVGDEVYGIVKTGGYAEYVLAKSDEVATKPATIDFLHAAAIPLAALTAWQAMFDLGKLGVGQKILITAAAGGVGSLAVQLAKARGAVVTGLASGVNEAFVRSLGVDNFVNYTEQPFEDLVTDMDVVFDVVGGDTYERAFKCLKKEGSMVTAVAFPTPQQGALYGVSASRVYCKPNQDELDEISQLVLENKLKSHISQVFPLEQVDAAHKLSKQGHTRGKIILQIGADH